MADAKPKAAVVVFPGSNGDRDLCEAFEAAGFVCEFMSAADPVASDIDAVGLPGGFSYGDYWRAGMLANQAPAVRSLVDHVARGGLVIGVCNGFQILAEAQLLPTGLYYNTPAGFRHRWVDVALRRNDAIHSPWTAHLNPEATLKIPMANGEGRIVRLPNQDAVTFRRHLVATYLDNPNGSDESAAAMVDETGRVLGIMPHPERAIDEVLGSADGLGFFTSAHRWLVEQRSQS